MRRRFALAVIVVLAFMVGCSSKEEASNAAGAGKATQDEITSEEAEESTEKEEEVMTKKSIDGFKDYDWGTDFQTIKENEITSDMGEFDYSIFDQDTLTTVKVDNGSVAGYDAEEEYQFLDNKLVGGIYSIRLWSYDENWELLRPSDREENETNNDILTKYSDIYGEPIKITYDDEDELDTALWADDNKNFIVIVFLGDTIYIYYGQPYEEYVDYASEFLEYDLIQEIEKPGNHSGI